MNTNILSFDQFFEKTNENEEINERVEIYALSKMSTSKEDFRNKLVSQLRKTAPSLADDENFVDNIVNTYDSDTEEVEPAQ